MMASVEGALSADSDTARARLTADVRQKRLDYFAASAVASAYVIPRCSVTCTHRALGHSARLFLRVDHFVTVSGKKGGW